MKHDPKQIVTPFAFEVSPDLLGLPLATPRRRLAALLIDLLFASILTSLGSIFFATISSVLFFWLAIRNRSSNFGKNLVRFGSAFLFSIFVFTLTYMLSESSNNENESDISSIVSTDNDGIIIDTTNQIDWMSIAKQVGELSNNDSISSEEKIEVFAKNLESKYSDNTSDNYSYPEKIFTPSFNQDLANFSIAINNTDTLAIDSLRLKITPIIAFNELSEKEVSIDKLNNRIEKLDNENSELKDQIENPSFLRTLKASAEDFGLSIGWIGIYIVLCTALFKGQTLGKRLLQLRVVRLNNKPIGLLYSFERFGGYAAGVATGLLGFIQIYWDSNRQGIHDKIASTVVLDTREKTMKKYEYLNKDLTK